MVFRGRDDLRVLLGAVYSSVEQLHWDEPITNGSVCVVTGSCRVGRFRLDDSMVVERNPDGSIARVRPHLRPWLATTVFALRLGLKMSRHPGVLLRALRSS